VRRRGLAEQGGELVVARVVEMVLPAVRPVVDTGTDTDREEPAWPAS